MVACNLITYSDTPPGDLSVTGTDGAPYDPELVFSVFPNPAADGVFQFVLKDAATHWLDVSVFDAVEREFDIPKKTAPLASDGSISAINRWGRIFWWCGRGRGLRRKL